MSNSNINGGQDEDAAFRTLFFGYKIHPAFAHSRQDVFSVKTRGGN